MSPLHSPFRSIFYSAVRGVSLVVLVGHFALTFVYVVPVNPLLLKEEWLIQRITAQYFGQVWTLFGPDPLTTNDALLVRVLSKDEALSIDLRGFPVDGWHDISTPLWQEFQSHRLSMYDRAYRPQMSGMISYLSGGSDLIDWQRAAWKDENPDARTIYETMLKQERDDATSLLTRTASSYLNQTCPQSECTVMALQIRIESAIPWSKRGDNSRTVRYVKLGVFPIDKTVHPATFYLPHSLTAVNTTEPVR
jgi:Family of unknown function (DUF5819)